MKFTIQHKDVNSNARAGKITTDHGVIETPIFMPVGAFWILNKNRNIIV